jgi:glyoxylase-like metal-dependent hydrolase (beta-lactamase superfamily II)
MKIVDRLHGFIWTSMTSNNCNTYLIDASVKILIDPGHIMHFDHVRNGLSNLGLGLEDIGLLICTHAHPDHIEAAQLFREGPTQIAMHQMSWQLIENFGKMIDPGMNIEAYRPDIFLGDGKFTVGDVAIQAIHTPGHAPGSITLLWPEKNALIVGDLIFKDGIGRTDIPGGDGNQLKQSIRRVAQMDADYLLPGHGDVIVGKEAIKENFKQVENFWFNYI